MKERARGKEEKWKEEREKGSGNLQFCFENLYQLGVSIGTSHGAWTVHSRGVHDVGMQGTGVQGVSMNSLVVHGVGVYSMLIYVVGMHDVKTLTVR